jgi:hypothetical protein
MIALRDLLARSLYKVSIRGLLARSLEEISIQDLCKISLCTIRVFPRKISARDL